MTSEHVDVGKLPAFVIRALAQIAGNNILDHNFIVQHSAGSKHGDGFASKMLAVTLTDASGVRSLSLICKLQLPVHGGSSALDNDVIFRREIEMYTKVLPMLAELQRNHGLDEQTGFFAYPKCYFAQMAANNESLIVLEDLRTAGFSLTDKTKPCTIAQIELFVRQLGRYNGLSFVLRDKRPEVFASLMQLDDILADVMTNNTAMSTYYVSSIEKSVEVVESQADKQLMQTIRNESLTLLRIRQNASRVRQFAVLSHGDCHINNMMFREADSVSSIGIVQQQIV